MASGQVRLRLDLGKLQARAGTLSKAAVKRAATAAERRVRANIIQSDLMNTGEMLNKVQQRDIPSPLLYPRVAVGSSAPHVKYPEFGTRAHGPVKASALRFKPKGSNVFVFAKWVRGVQPYRFMRRALDAMRPSDFEQGGI